MPLWIAINALCFQGRSTAQSLNLHAPSAPADTGHQAGPAGSGLALPAQAGRDGPNLPGSGSAAPGGAFGP
jgi:hypothetical protein